MDLNGLRRLINEVWKRKDILLESPDLITEAVINKNQYPFRALFVLGPAGSGKTYLIKHVLNVPFSEGKHSGKAFVQRNPDEVVEDKFPKFDISMKFVNDTTDEQGVPDEAAEKEKYQQQMSRAVAQMGQRGHTANLVAAAAPLLFDTTGEDAKKMGDRMKHLTELGYDVGVFLNMVPEDASVERDDKRDRTVGKETTTAIHRQYQQEVLDLKGYGAAMAENENVTLFMGGEAYWNVFDLKDGALLQKPTVITPEMLPDEINPEKNSEAFPKYKKMIEQGVAEMSAWKGGGGAEPENPKGQALLRGMKKLVDMTGGNLGNNMFDLGVAKAMGSPYTEDSDIMGAVEVIEAAGGVEVKVGEGGAPEAAAPADQPAVAPAIRGKKDTKGHTMRGLAGGEEGGRMTESDLADIITAEIFEVIYGSDS
jgi:hypothetical protein